MLCKCDAYTRVLDSRLPNDNHTWRRRRCPYCGFRFSTKEIPIEEYKELIRKVELLDKLKAAFEECYGE